MMDVFATDSLCAGYGGVPVIDRLDLRVSEGEFAAVIGPNGSGKSTLVKSLTGFLKPLAGAVSFRGREIGRYSKRLLARELASVQQFMPDPLPFRVRDFIAMGRFPHRRLLEMEGRSGPPGRGTCHGDDRYYRARGQEHRRAFGR